MVLKNLLIGILTGGSLLVMCIPLKKMPLGIWLLIMEIGISFFSTIIALCFYPICVLIILSTNKAVYESYKGTSYTARFCYITAIAGPLAGIQYKLQDNTRLTIGRENCDILFPPDTQGVGRHHCMVYMENGKVYLVDEHSTFGTFILPNRERVLPYTPLPLHDNEEFCLASQFVVFKTQYNYKREA